MNLDLLDLRMTEKELETLTGFEVNPLFIGGPLGGAYRPSLFQNSQRIISFGITQLLVLGLIFILTFPIGLSVIRNASRAVNDLPTITPFLQVTLGITLIMFIGWNCSMRLKLKPLKTLSQLLDEVDRYNEVIQAVDVLDQLKATGMQTDLTDRQPIIEALSVTRNSLVSGLTTEKILRENRSLLERHRDLFTNIENNLATLRSLEVTNQATEYVELLNQALNIGMSVHQEVQQFSQQR